MSDKPKDWPPRENWVSDGNEVPVTEGYLVGDRKGLASLQKAIQVALDSKDGEADIKELRSSWSHVLVRAVHPEEEQKSSDASPRAKVVKIAGLGVIGAMIFMMIYGCTQLPALLK